MKGSKKKLIEALHFQVYLVLELSDKTIKQL